MNVSSIKCFAAIYKEMINKRKLNMFMNLVDVFYEKLFVYFIILTEN